MKRYQITERIRLVITDAAIDVLHRYRQRDNMDEAGGILLGRDFVHNGVEIEEVTIPKKPDAAGRRWFDRSRARAQHAVDTAWHRSDGELIYLGEWHSHPQDFPVPSDRDTTMIRNMLNETQMEIDFLFLVIVGRLGLWVGMQTPTGLRQLEEIDADSARDDLNGQPVPLHSDDGDSTGS